MLNLKCKFTLTGNKIRELSKFRLMSKKEIKSDYNM